MSYYAYDDSGYLGDAASVEGWDAFAQWANEQGGELALFANAGESSNLPALIQQLTPLTAPDADVESTRANLLELAKKATGGLLISDGFEEG